WCRMIGLDASAACQPSTFEITHSTFGLRVLVSGFWTSLLTAFSKLNTCDPVLITCGAGTRLALIFFPPTAALIICIRTYWPLSGSVSLLSFTIFHPSGDAGSLAGSPPRLVVV